MINFDSIVNELKKGLVDIKDYPFVPKHVAVREYRTVSVGVRRQLGKTEYLLNQFIKNKEQSIYFTLTAAHKTDVCERLGTHYDELKHRVFINGNLTLKKKEYTDMLQALTPIRFIYVDECRSGLGSRTLEILSEIVEDDVVIISMFT